MKYSNKEELRKSITGFLRQRLFLYRGYQNSQLEGVCVRALAGFDMMGNWNYWRHCLEVKNMEPQLLRILPSAEGKHSVIRARVLHLIGHCKDIASISSERYDEEVIKKLEAKYDESIGFRYKRR